MGTKPLGYWGCDYDNQLILDISETWGDFLNELTESDTLWLIARIAHEAWVEHQSTSAPSTEAEEVVNRLHELKNTQKVALIQALANS